MKKWISILLVIIFAAVVTGLGVCVVQNSGFFETNGKSAVKRSDSSTTKLDIAEKPTELVIAFVITGAQPTDIQMIEDELNKLVTPKINVKVKLKPVNFGAAQQQYNLMLAGGEKLDLMMTFPNTYTSLVSQRMIREIGPLIDRYGVGIKKALGKYYTSSTVNGKVYGVRPVCEMGSGGGFLIRKDLVEKYKLDVTHLKSIADVGNMLKIIKQHEPDAYPLSFSNQGIGIVSTIMAFSMDNLSDGFGVLMDYGQTLKVVNQFETNEYRNNLKMVRDWYHKGYIMKDAATNKENQHSLMMAGRSYGYFTPTKPEIAVQESSQNGYECVVPEITVPFSSSFNGTLFDWVVPYNCERPDKAVQMLNLMYTDSDVENILSWGVEGVHYEKKPNGTIGFPTGITAKNSGYFIRQPWMMGNELLTYVWNGSPKELWKDMDKFNNRMRLSKAIGFVYDPTPVKTQVVAVARVYGEYKLGIENGTVDVEAVYPQFIKKLKAAGINKIIAEKQRQLNKWAMANHIR